MASRDLVAVRDTRGRVGCFEWDKPDAGSSRRSIEAKITIAQALPVIRKQ